jgi:GWxTD domain-containing protein
VRSTIEAPLRIPSLTEYPSLSDVEVLKRGDGAHTGVRAGFVPNITRIFSGERDSMPFYYEVYRDSAGDTLTVVHELIGEDGATVFEGAGQSAGMRRTAHLVMLPADTLANGRYTLRVSLKTASGERGATRSEALEIRHETFHLDRDFDQAVALLTYLAGGGEIEAFEKAGEEDRKKIWEEFWREKDPTPGTPRNEFFEEHLRRFRHANEHFRAPLVDGWKTDRGRIYILYGEPDEVESHPFEMGSKPTEVWHYFGQGRRFVFVDETGFGDYVLVGSGG